MASKRALLGFLLGFFVYNSLGSNIATFEDAKCKDSKQNINGPNGYPNGTCTPLDTKGSYKSFQVVGLDEGCSVTLYGNDSDPDSPCSSETQLEFPRIGTCYNASWIYYSIDFCDIPEENPSSLSSLRASSTSTTSSSSSTLTSSSTPTPIQTIFPKRYRKSKTGVIAGGVVGGAVGLALVAGLVYFSIRRNRRMQQEAQRHFPVAAPKELSNQDAKHEIYSHEASLPPQEIGSNSVHVPPSELHGDEPKGLAESGAISDEKRSTQ